MLRITLTQDNGFPPATPLSHDFDERGGTIGRDASNALALPDPNRHISRMQAQIGHDGESYILTDHGGNPTSLNGRPLGKGVRASLHDGDEIGIADCVLRVEIVTGASPAGSAAPSPASDPLGLFAPPPAQAAITPPPTTAKSSSPQSTPYDEDPFAVFVPPAKPATPDTPETPAAHGIDPFAPTARPPADPDSNRAGADPLGIGGITGAERPSSLDALFGLDAAGSGHDPFAGSPLGDPAHAPIPSDRESDPFALFGSDAPPTSCRAPATIRPSCTTPLRRRNRLKRHHPKRQAAESPGHPEHPRPHRIPCHRRHQGASYPGQPRRQGRIQPGNLTRPPRRKR